MKNKTFEERLEDAAVDRENSHRQWLPSIPVRRNKELKKIEFYNKDLFID